jgi:bacterioferritin
MAKIVDLLNEAAAGELQAIIQYMWQHVMVSGMNSPQVGKLLRETAIGEMKHYEKIAERIDYLGGVPTTQPAPVKTSKGNIQMLKDDVQAEEEAIRMYRNIIEVAMREKDYATMEMFEDILAEEEEHHYNFKTLLA